ncbi:MAG TPA: dihydrolipoamide acetyltransferase family protein [Longimicrobiales bacterium]|nr:dihydrolipoamide acetyltransferase family protein [Longimicrobiales bacterium]
MAKVDVPMPQMGESIAEGTVSKWLKKVGDKVARDEPLLEISTDKVDAEIPSPSAGVLAEIKVQEGTTVEVGAIVAVIDTEAGAAAAAPAASAPTPAPEAKQPANAVAPEARPQPQAATATAPAPAADGGAGNGKAETAEERLKQKSTPLVRRIAAEHNVDIGSVQGSGYAGRVTKNDIMSYIEQGGPKQPAPAQAPAQRPAAAPPVGGDFWNVFYKTVQHPEFAVREGDKVQPMDRVRRLTADHMVRAKRVAPHVHSFIEIDFTRIDQVRKKNAAKWEQQGIKVSYTAFVAWACAQLIGEFPMINATISGENIIYRGDINVGIAVDLNPGLIVPVVKNADELNVAGVAKRITDLADRARSKKLKPDEVQGATFSITNPGVLGTIVGMPIIPEGTAAILGTGAIEKRVVVVQDADGNDVMAIRKRSFFSLGYDHRLVDGADAARFMSRLKQVMESFPEDA